MTDYPKISEGILGEQDVPKTNTELFLSLVGQYFPEAIKDGEVDFAALKEEMGEFAEIGSEHYDFTWAGKQAAKKEAQADLFGKTLRYKPEDSLNPDTTENIYIEGDNLEALKLLRRNYHGKIKMIYIDPPYNTGNDFVYHDDFSMTDEELAELSGDVVDGVRFQKNSKDSARYHTDWLNMMYPRLRVARELLTDDGVIFISLDDNEIGNLRKLCDNIFGEKNFVANLVWQKKFSRSNDATYFSTMHDHILCYCKTNRMMSDGGWQIGLLPRGDEIPDGYGNPDNDPRGDWTSVILSAKSGSPSLLYEITTPSGRVVSPPSGRFWSCSKETFEKWKADNRIWFGADGNGTPRKKTFLSEVQPGLRPNTLLFQDEAGNNQEAKQEVKSLFDGKGVFDGPKPVRLLRLLMTIANLGKNDTVLDFFSGCATTAHAVFAHNFQNVYDGKKGNVKFILVQLPELCDEKSEAYKAGYKNICEIGKERIRRAGRQEYMSIRSTAGNSLRWNDEKKAELGDAYVCPEDVDIGFKVFEVGGTTIRWNSITDSELADLSEIDYSTGDTDALDFTAGHNDTDIVYEIMLRQYGIPLSTPIEKLDSISDRTYAFADAVVVCLEPKITDELIEKLAAIEPTPAKFVLRDSAFGDNIEFKDFSFRKLSALISNHQTEEERKSRYNNYTVEFI